MKFSDLTEDQINQAREIYQNNTITWDQRMKSLEALFGKSERTVRRWCSGKLGFKEKSDVLPEVLTLAKNKTHDKEKKRFLITAAQNATPVNKTFFNNLKAYAQHINAEILVIPYRYKNPTSIWSDNDKKDDWWDEEVIPYLTLNRHDLNDSIAVLSNVKIQPTSSMPLSGLENMTGDHSSVVGHPRLHLKTLPRLETGTNKIIFTTGACTKRNYIESKIGEIGSFHHVYGAAIVEIKDKNNFFTRQISATEDGNFIDLYYKIQNNGVSIINSVEAFVLGDIHYGNHNEILLKSTFEGIVPKLNPKQIICHDLFDGSSINHHEANNLLKQYQNEVNGVNSLKKEIENMLNWLETVKKYNIVIVFSNHDDFLNRFIINADIKKNIKNAVEYMEYGKILLEGKAPNGLIPFIINKKFKKIKCLGRNESFKIKGWELGIHGMDGINGSRGSVQQYRRLNTKVISAHAHTPARYDGAIQVGTNTILRMGYNNGISNWGHGDAIIHSNGKSQMILYNSKGEFTTFK